MDKYYTTKKLIGPKRAQLWRQFISETFVELDCNGMSTKSFFGELRARSVGELGISTITTDAYDVFRTDRQISQSGRDDFIVSIQTKGQSVIRQLDRDVVLLPGDFTIYDAAMPYHLHFKDRLSQLVVKVPRAQLKTHLQTPESFTALHYKGGEGLSQITTQFAQSLFDQANSLDDYAQSRVSDTFVSLLTASIREATTQYKRAPRNKETQLLRVKHYVAKNLRDPNLNLKTLAAAHNISERYLHVLFKRESITPSRFIWNERLKAAHIDLSNPLLAHRSVSEICFAWGFNDTAHFSRSFKSKYGLSPRDLRKTHL